MAAAKQQSTVVGVFKDRQQANQAVSDLLKAGFRQDQIGVAMRHAEAEGDERTTTTADASDSHAGSGAITGALAGLGLGALAGLGVLAGVIPVVGPAIAAGTLGVILSNAAAGAGIAGVAGALIGAGVPEHEANYYDKRIRGGPDDRDCDGGRSGRRGDGHPAAVRGVRREQPERPAEATHDRGTAAHGAGTHAARPKRRAARATRFR